MPARGRQTSARVILELPLSDPADLLGQLAPRGSFQYGDPIAQPLGHLVGTKFGDEKPVPANEKRVPTPGSSTSITATSGTCSNASGTISSPAPTSPTPISAFSTIS